MADKSAIEWTDATWNPIVGCSIVSPGCTNCYAMKMAARIIAMAGTRDVGVHYDRTIQDVKGKPVWTGHVALAPDRILTAPLRWKRPRRVFVNSMGDLFHESIPDEWIDRVFAVMALTPQHTYQVLTKRAERMRAYLAQPVRRVDVNGFGGEKVETRAQAVKAQAYFWQPLHRCDDRLKEKIALPLPNVWLGVSCERQQEADERIPLLLQTPAAIRFVSCEPLLGPIDLDRYLWRSVPPSQMPGSALNDAPGASEYLKPRGDLHWIIVGGESGSNARPMHPDWARSLRDQCAAAGVAYFFKQWGEYASAFRHLSAHHMVFRQFTTCQQWVDKASGWVNGGICLDTHGNELKNGAAFRRAEDEGRFPVTIMHRVGKKAAGRLLDGKEHNAFPSAAREAEAA